MNSGSDGGNVNVSCGKVWSRQIPEDVTPLELPTRTPLKISTQSRVPGNHSFNEQLVRANDSQQKFADTSSDAGKAADVTSNEEVQQLQQPLSSEQTDSSGLAPATWGLTVSLYIA